MLIVFEKRHACSGFCGLSIIVAANGFSLQPLPWVLQTLSEITITIYQGNVSAAAAIVFGQT